MRIAPGPRDDGGITATVSASPRETGMRTTTPGPHKDDHMVDIVIDTYYSPREPGMCVAPGPGEDSRKVETVSSTC